MLKGKTAVITGCLSGIGLATLDTFSRNSADVFACIERDSPEFTEHIGELSRECGNEIIPILCDLLDTDSIRSAVKSIQTAKKKIDILVNIAGMTQDALFHMVTMEQMKRVFEVNFFSQMLFTQYISKLMLRNQSGSIINTSSISALDGNPGQLSYSASKAAFLGATRTLSAELAPKGIRVNAIAPGVILTAMTRDLPEEAVSRLLKRSDIKRLGLPEEVANTILFLASDRASFITGQVIRIDGGIG